MGKIVENDYQENTKLTPDEVRRALSGDFEGFKYYFEHCMLIQDRDTRQYIHPKMNAGQERIAKTILKYVDKDTRATRHKECVIVGPRQFGKSTLLTTIAHYIEAYVPGMENLNCVHTLHTGDAATKFFMQKLAPIITNTHPDIYPTIERTTTQGSTILTYKDVKGIRRGGNYEILSAGSNSVRSGTVSVWLCDEPSEYRNPEGVEDAISGAISTYGWSLTAYIGTFSDRLSPYFLNKIKLANEHAEGMDLVFIPWFLVYGREGDRQGLTENDLTDYDREVIIPEMSRLGIPSELWMEKLGWYHERSRRTSKMRYEFPTSIEDILTMTSDRAVFSNGSLDAQGENIVENPQCYKFLTDNQTGQVEAHPTDVSPFVIYTLPEYGHRYRLAIDPITARSDHTDFFVMSVFDLANNEQVAVFSGRNMDDEEYADWAVSIATIYNKAELCPEINVAAGFVVAVNSRHYYHWFYANAQMKKDRVPGLRTTASSKELMVDRLNAMLDRKSIIIRDRQTIDECRHFLRKLTKRSRSTFVQMEAATGWHDDRVASLFIYAGSLDIAQIEGRTTSGFAIL